MTGRFSRLAAALAPHRDAPGDVARLRRLVSCDSLTGREAEIAVLLERELAALGATDVVREPFAAGRFNVRGRRKADAERPTVLLVGHTDTVRTAGWAERWQGTGREDPLGAAIVGDEMWGRGTADMKAGIATALSAVALLDRAGIPGGCSLQFAFVGDEESGEEGSGVSAGMKSLAAVYDGGGWDLPDFAIYGEPSSLDVYPAHMGFFIADIEFTGRSAYFGLPEEGIDALKAAHPALAAIWSYSDALGAGRSHPAIGRALVVVTSIEAGGTIAVPGRCRLGLIRKLLPGEDPGAEAAALERVVRDAVPDGRVAVAIRYPAGRDHAVGGSAYGIDADQPPIRLLQAAIRAVRPSAGNIGPCAGWSEAPFLAARGVPTVYFSPGDFVHCHTLEERVDLTAYADGVMALALFLASFGSGEAAAPPASDPAT